MMAAYNPNDYETVDERLRRLYKDHPNARIVTENLTTKQDRQVSTWVVRAELWLPMTVINPDYVFTGNNYNDFFLKSTGMAFEVDGGKGPQSTSALEVCETSAIGRALANGGYSGNKRASREEMEKVARAQTPQPTRDWVAEVKKLKNVDEARHLYNEARQAKVSVDVLKLIEDKAATLG